MATTRKNKKSEVSKFPDASTIWKNTKQAFFTSIVVVKVLGIGGAGAYLIGEGMNKPDAVYIGLGSVLAGYAIVVFVSTAHTATKTSRA